MVKSLELLEKTIENELQALNLQLVELKKLSHNSINTLRIVINDPEKHVGHEQCTSVIKSLQASLPDLNEDFNVEVWSPGVGRELKSEREFQVFKGKLVEITFLQKKVKKEIGILKLKENNQIAVLVNEEEKLFDCSLIQKVILALCTPEENQQQNTEPFEISVEDI